MSKAEAQIVSDRLREIYKRYLEINSKKQHNQTEFDYEFDLGFGQEQK